MNTEQLSSLVATLERAGVSELTYRDGTRTLTLRFTDVAEPLSDAHRTTVKPSAAITAPPAQCKEVLSGATGTFSRRHPLAADASSDAVKQGDHVGYLTIDSVLSAIIAPAAGMAGNQLVDNGETVGYGDPVLELHDA
ncbi:conserved hypothetical protein [Cupriavidus taiwanensis]|uniref:hypothetical protein n=1 Tax=Cupriavidus taiwanensis TaxID=164546 RepID=UPI000E163DEB|nr:hypothetical protein [Cupriavidus taiwanensis]SOY93376.1 conserved hypothetical protein [Cupriavidus taiwanensis]SOY96382.1 conserved hypothetical protein [Cupriavidus taiwanensis]